MDASVDQELLIAGAGIAVIVLALVVARRRLLTVRYAVGWIVLGALIVVLALCTPLIEPVTDRLGMTPTGLLLFLASGTLLLICVQLSITASGLTARQRDLTEAIALLEARVAEIEPRSPTSDAPPAGGTEPHAR